MDATATTRSYVSDRPVAAVQALAWGQLQPQQNFLIAFITTHVSARLQLHFVLHLQSQSPSNTGQLRKASVHACLLPCSADCRTRVQASAVLVNVLAHLCSTFLLALAFLLLLRRVCPPLLDEVCPSCALPQELQCLT